jgi:hypothetical protein
MKSRCDLLENSLASLERISRLSRPRLKTLMTDLLPVPMFGFVPDFYRSFKK